MKGLNAMVGCLDDYPCPDDGYDYLVSAESFEVFREQWLVDQRLVNLNAADPVERQDMMRVREKCRWTSKRERGGRQKLYDV